MRTRRRFLFTRHVVVSASLVLFASAVFTALAGAGGGTPPGQVAPSATSLPTIAGTAQEGETLTASPGDWSGVSLDFTFQWNRCSSSGASCAPVGGASGTVYRLGPADVGTTLRVSVAAVNKRGTATAFAFAQPDGTRQHGPAADRRHPGDRNRGLGHPGKLERIPDLLRVPVEAV